MIRCVSVFATVYEHNTRVCVCMGGRGVGGGGDLWVYIAYVSGPMCMFVFVIRGTARRFSLPLRTKIKS